MTQDDIIRTAHKANFEGFGNGDWVCTTEEIQRFAQLIAAHEREACAKVCESLAGQQWVTREAALECSDAIRARGNT
jgi:hypothetical protein